MDAPRALLIDCSFVFYIMLGSLFVWSWMPPGTFDYFVAHVVLYNVGTAFGVALDATRVLLSDFS